MNQILATEPEKNKKNPTDTKKIVRFFCITILIFGFLLIGKGSYALYKNVNEMKLNQRVAQINVTRNDRKLDVSVIHDKVIDKLMYHWNDEPDTVISGNNKISFTQELDIPVGENKLSITVIDITGKQSKFEETYVQEKELLIELSIVGNKINIKAKDEDGMSYMTYRWNNEQERRINAEPNAKEIIQEADIPVGLNTLVINAVNINNIVKTKEQEIKGVKKPTVEAYRDGEYIVVTIKDEEGIKEISHSINNGEPQIIEGDNQKEIQYKQQVLAGDNYLNIKVTSNSGAKTDFQGICYNQ